MCISTTLFFIKGKSNSPIWGTGGLKLNPSSPLGGKPEVQRSQDAFGMLTTLLLLDL